MKITKRYELINEISRGDKMGVRMRIIHHILSSSNGKSFLTELTNVLKFSKRTLLSHLAYLVHKGILSFEYDTVAIGEEHRPVVIKWYRVNKSFEWLRQIELSASKKGA